MNEKTINLKELSAMCGLTPVRCAGFSEAAAVCLEKLEHKRGVIIALEGNFPDKLPLNWDTLPAEAFVSWKNLDETVEFAACAVSVFCIFEKTRYMITEQSVKGDGFDFLLSEKQDTTLKKDKSFA